MPCLRSKWLATALLLIVAQSAFANDASLTVHVDQSRATISPTLYGIFFEEINRAGDGGLYGEMIENRSFEDDKEKPTSWSSLGKGTLSLDQSLPLNSRNPTALRVDIPEEGGGVSNAGFKDAGLAIRSGESYRLSLYIRGEKLSEALHARLESSTGSLLAEQTVTEISGTWKKMELELTSKDEDLVGRLVLQTQGSGTLWLDMVSLFPKQTWKNHGMRTDLAEMVANMNPSFVRFPGGCFVEGDTMASAVRWKDTIGDVAQRKGNWCIWGYQTTGGFGVHEFLQWCEDLDAEPLYVINCGMAHKDSIPMDKMDEFVHDALDLIEYARGPVTSKWGALRAEAGHPEPFKMNYLQIGNENGGPLYEERYALFSKAIRKKHPDIQLIACDWGVIPDSYPLDIIDEHYYNTPRFFIEHADMHDAYDRSDARIYVGEYAVTQGCGQGNLIAALGEAAYMTGLERNSDHVVMSSYAPLFVNPDWRRWSPDAIVFDQARSYGTPSYHVQALFANHRGDVICPSELKVDEMEEEARAGYVGVGTWITQAEFKDIQVTKDGKTLFQSDFSTGSTDRWRMPSGQWEATEGVLRQTSMADNVRAMVGTASWNDYTLSLKARKLSGNEGFLIMFQHQNEAEKHWWNIGGWGNTASALEGLGDGERVPMNIETGRWYDIRVELRDKQVTCWLDGKKIHEATQKTLRPLYAVASRTKDNKELILKVVNVSSNSIKTTIKLDGAQVVQPEAKVWTMSSPSFDDENSFANPHNIAPEKSDFSEAATEFDKLFPARSVTIMRIGIESESDK
ncbi:Extracellular exo-alpha-L-arabinofuranosidase precursor [Planctomycetes bacterium CA13]|uniref:non-reducing end alpha-L-arabinofuranosidase n=1 Tax=Novipirellula herctigrandis TaxID=2527986 RepID=A0A5C5YPI6_9BACT|nr:Extracellular exo-alpha-L-arabinofuranosidase precursor [Planctomycetes bacterium CA13]